MLLIWLNNMMHYNLYVDLKIRSYFNYVVIFFCYLLSFCCENAGNGRGYELLDIHEVWRRALNVLSSRK